MARWVFGYGSLLWNPEFEPAATELARLEGWHRSFCMQSLHHRGTVERPGLVLALDRTEGAYCDGLALEIPSESESEIMEMIRARELVSDAYIEREVVLDLAGGRNVEAITYVMDRSHSQYCGNMELAEQARIIARAKGGRGSNPEYLFRTVEHMNALGIVDPELNLLAERVRALVVDV